MVTANLWFQLRTEVVNSRIAWLTAVLSVKVLTDDCCVVFVVFDNVAMRADTAEFAGLAIHELAGVDADKYNCSRATSLASVAWLVMDAGKTTAVCRISLLRIVPVPTLFAIVPCVVPDSVIAHSGGE